MFFKFTIIKWRTFPGLKRTVALNPFHCNPLPIISVDKYLLFIFVFRNRIIYGFILHFLVITGKKQINNK